MDKCLKLLSLFNKRSKLIYLNGHTKFQILTELKVFNEILDDKELVKLDLNNFIFNNNFDSNKLDRKIVQHNCNNLYFDFYIDDIFFEINRKCKNIKFDNLSEFILIDEYLNNPRVKDFKDITISKAISIFDDTYDGSFITKKDYIELINSMLEDYNKEKTDNFTDNLLLYENAFSSIEYSISKVKDRIEIYQELIILICKLSKLYNLEVNVLLEYINLYLDKLVNDLILIDDNSLIIQVIKIIYRNTDFNLFYSFFPYFVEPFSPNTVKLILSEFKNDLFITKNDNHKLLENLLIFCSGDLFTFQKVLNENQDIAKINKDISLLEFSINYLNKDSVEFFWNKIIFDKNYYDYQDIIDEMKIIVDNFDRIESVEKKFNNITLKNIDKLLIEIEKLNYLNRKVYSCATNRIYYNYFDKKTFSFEFLLILINLGLESKAKVYFYHNMKYLEINEKNAKEIFIQSNILFNLNYFTISNQLLLMLYFYFKKNNTKDNSTLFSYIILELKILKNMLIPTLNNYNWNDISLDIE